MNDRIFIATSTIAAAATTILTTVMLVWLMMDSIRNDLKADIRELRQDIQRIDERLDSFGERITENKTRLDALE